MSGSVTSRPFSNGWRSHGTQVIIPEACYYHLVRPDRLAASAGGLALDRDRGPECSTPFRRQSRKPMANGWAQPICPGGRTLTDRRWRPVNTGGRQLLLIRIPYDWLDLPYSAAAAGGIGSIHVTSKTTMTSAPSLSPPVVKHSGAISLRSAFCFGSPATAGVSAEGLPDASACLSFSPSNAPPEARRADRLPAALPEACGMACW